VVISGGGVRCMGGIGYRGGGVFGDWGGIGNWSGGDFVDDGSSQRFTADDSVESVDGISGVVDGASVTVGVDQ